MGNPFVHVELNTSNVPKAKKFYSKLFKWKLSEFPLKDGTMYTVIDVGKGTGGGMIKYPMPRGEAMWLTYVLVDNISTATKKAKSLGAKILKDVTEVKGVGWLSIIKDPTGATLGLWKPKKRR
jgi:uncharacterized protein